MNCCDSISKDKCVGSCNTHARDTPLDAAEDMALGLYRTGTEVYTGTSRSTVYMMHAEL